MVCDILLLLIMFLKVLITSELLYHRTISSTCTINHKIATKHSNYLRYKLKEVLFEKYLSKVQRKEVTVNLILAGKR